MANNLAVTLKEPIDPSYLFAKPFKLFAFGRDTGLSLTAELGQVTILEVNGKKVKTRKCCGAVDTTPCIDPARCEASIINKQASRMNYMRHIKPTKDVSKRARILEPKFRKAHDELENIVRDNAFTWCLDFKKHATCMRYNKGKPCVHFPCKHRGKDTNIGNKVDKILSELDL